MSRHQSEDDGELLSYRSQCWKLTPIVSSRATLSAVLACTNRPSNRRTTTEGFTSGLAYPWIHFWECTHPGRPGTGGPAPSED